MDDVEHLAEVEARCIVSLGFLVLALGDNEARIVLNNNPDILGRLVVGSTAPDEFTVLVTEVLSQVKTDTGRLAVDEDADGNKFTGLSVYSELFSNFMKCCLDMDVFEINRLEFRGNTSRT